MEKVIQILSSPTLWSTGVAFFAVYVGLRHYIKKIISEDKAIEEKRRQKRSLDEQNAE